MFKSTSPLYRPLVILDEVHAAQGRRTAQIINSLHDKAIVAGFTATDGGAADSLFQRQKPIYQLGIVPAIENGLLCNGVRTGLIEVDIDEEWVKNFQKTPTGREYDQDTIRRFATDPAVLKATVEFHLTQDDPQLGALHRLPTIFFTQGVDSAIEGMKKFNEQAEKLDLPPEFRADYVSGVMPPEERNEKLRRFREGEIIALWNDRVLEMGFNDKNATVCYSLKPTRYTHTTEQQLGRITRKPDAGYAKKFGTSKVGLAINVRASGTDPVLFGDVLAGQPAIYSRSHPASTRRKEGVGGWQPIIKGARFCVDFDELEAVHANDASLPSKEEGWLSESDCRVMLGTRDAVIAARKELFALYDEAEGGIQSIEYKGQIIRLQKMYSGRSHKTICIAAEDWPNVLLAAGVLPDKDKHWLTDSDCKRMPNGRLEDVKATRKALFSLYDEAKGGPQPIEYNDQTIHLQKMQSGPRQLICIAAKDWPQVLLAAGGPNRDAWLSERDCAAMPSGRREKVIVARQALRGLYNEVEGGPQPIHYNGQIIRLQKILAGRSSNQPICIAREDWPNVLLAAEAEKSNVQPVSFTEQHKPHTSFVNRHQQRSTTGPPDLP